MLGVQGAAAASPVGGRSRYSKALPSVPVVDNSRAPLPQLPKDLLELQFPLPPATSPLPASHGNDDSKSVKSIVRKPVGSLKLKSGTPLPDTPSVNSPSLPTSSSAGSMTIPRKAVGGALQPPVQPTIIVPPEPSPTDSICSLLSAYSREPDAPMSGSTYTTSSTANSFRDADRGPSLGRDALLAGSHNYYSQTPISAVNNVPDSRQTAHSRPAPPPKDNNMFSPSSSPPKPLPVAPVSDKSSPPRPEIWKRRPQTAEKNKELPDLKLNYSHGLTASISSIKTVQTAVLNASSGTAVESKPAEEPKQSSPPRPPVVGLPGRNVRPATKAKTPETEMPMGSTSSKVQSIKNKFDSPRTTINRNEFPVRSDSKRPPTPEYRKGDVGPPSTTVDPIAKPASPVSATGSPKAGLLSDTSKSLPPQPPAPTPTSLLAPAPPTSGNRLPKAAPDLRLATSLQELRRGPSPPRERSPPSAAKGQFPPRNDSSRGMISSSDSASSRVSGQNGMGPGVGEPRRPGTATGSSDPRIVISDTQGPMFRGRDGTLYPEMKVTADPDPRAAYFPIQTDRPFGPGTIIPSKPLNQGHYDCFQGHRTMNRRSNRHYPLTCQTCDKADAEDRWACSFCYLRICETCLRGLTGHQKVLRSLVDQIRTNTPLSLSSTSRPASALGLELPA